jgi:general secretion pathway protein C
MATTLQGRWAVRLTTLVLWMLVAGSCVYWVLRIAPRGPAAMVAAPARTAFAADPAAVARRRGAVPALAAAAGLPAVSLASRFALVGVVAERSRRGAALIAVDGKPARPYRVGAAIDQGVLLQSVEGRRAVLSASVGGPALVTLELPRPGRPVP